MCFQETASVIESKKPAARRRYRIGKTDKPEIAKALDAFLNGDETRARFGNYFIDGPLLVFRTMVQDKAAHLDVKAMKALLTSMDTGQAVAADITRAELVELIKNEQVTHYRRQITVKTLRQNVIAMKLMRPDGLLIVGNSSVLELIGRRVAFGRELRNRAETSVQLELSKHVPMLPFSVFEQAGLDIQSLQVIAQAGAESVTRKYETGRMIKVKGSEEKTPEIKTETVHFTGASVFKVGASCFLFDIDRREIEHEIFNPFLVKLPRAVESIQAAYDLLKPDAVKAAEKAGLTVLRQGEWFFIPVAETVAAKLDGIKAKTPKMVKRITLQAGGNRPNEATGIQLHQGRAIPDERQSWSTDSRQVAARSDYFVTGRVTHTGREHAPILLRGWFKAVPNTATESFTITGDID
jgi:hypothetical protein